MAAERATNIGAWPSLPACRPEAQTRNETEPPVVVVCGPVPTSALGPVEALGGRRSGIRGVYQIAKDDEPQRRLEQENRGSAAGSDCERFVAVKVVDLPLEGESLELDGSLLPITIDGATRLPGRREIPEPPCEGFGPGCLG